MMKVTNKVRKKLRLTVKDNLIIEALNSGYNNSHKIAEVTSIARTTVSYRLKILEKQGLCKSKKVSNITQYEIISEEFTSKHSIIDTQEKGISFRGVEEFQNILEHISNQITTERIYVFEPSCQTKSFFNVLRKLKISKINENLKNNKVIVEALVGEKTLELNRLASKQEKESMFGRMTISYELSDDVLNFDKCIICTDRETYFFDYKDITGIKIENQIVTQTYRKIFDFYKKFGKRVDFNANLKI